MTDRHAENDAGRVSDRKVVEPTDGNTATQVPSDNTTLTAVLRELAGDGYRCSFVIRPDARVECTACRATSAAGDLEPEQTRRLEGASDPDDALLVVAAHCPACEAGATVVLGFGPAASDDDSLVVAQLVLDR